MACYRYIEHNPVRADMVNHPCDYPWSSYRFYAEGKKSDLLTPYEEYLRMDRQELNRRKAYRDLFKAHIDPDIDAQIRSATNGNFVLGNKRFQDQIAKVLGRSVTKGKSGRPKSVK